MTHPTPHQWLKFVLGWALCFAVRLLPWRPPNMEPVTATLMPFGKTFGALGGALFGFLSIALYDAATSGIGEWTFVTGISFALLGAASHFFFRHRRGTPWEYALFAVPATILYDLLTGVLYTPLRYDMTFSAAFAGQIPFTINHLLSNIVLALVVSPLLQRWMTENDRLTLVLPRLSKS